jgi:hypothetical protein
MSDEPRKIFKSQGQTPTEASLARFCDNTFLKLWSYANPFKSDGKELCDLIAVFENHVFCSSTERAERSIHRLTISISSGSAGRKQQSTGKALLQTALPGIFSGTAMKSILTRNAPSAFQ